MSNIEATGEMNLGDPNSLAGFFSDGELVVNEHLVTLRDANEAVVGSLTTLGNAGNPGILFAGNGIVVEFGKNITGYGTVFTPNDPMKPLINNGFIEGSEAGVKGNLPATVEGEAVGEVGKTELRKGGGSPRRRFTRAGNEAERAVVVGPDALVIAGVQTRPLQ